MLLLSVDTAGAAGGVLLARTDAGPFAPENTLVENTRVLGVCSLPPRESSVQMFPAIAKLLKENGWAIADIDMFAVVSGPGSFTGLRVGISAVKALAESTGKPIVALSRLAILASMAPDAELIHAALDAGRGEFYHGAYRDAGRTCVSESLKTLPDLIATLRREPGIVVASEPSVVSELAMFAPREIPEIAVTDMLPLALAAWQARRFTDVAALDANYLRRHDLEMPTKLAAPISASET